MSWAIVGCSRDLAVSMIIGPNSSPTFSSPGLCVSRVSYRIFIYVLRLVNGVSREREAECNKQLSFQLFFCWSQ